MSTSPDTRNSVHPLDAATLLTRIAPNRYHGTTSPAYGNMV
jgi:hypothetical protein